MSTALFCTPHTLKSTGPHTHAFGQDGTQICPATLKTRHRPNRANPLHDNKPCTNQRTAVHAKLPSILTAKNSVVPRLVPVARTAWHTLWRLFMGQLAPSDASGRYIRPSSSASSATPPPDGINPTQQNAISIMNAFAQRADPARPVVYVGLACPWCHRVLLALALTGLASSHDVRFLDPGPDGLWRLARPEGHCRRLKDVYLDYDPRYSGRFTAPLYLERDTSSLVSNESADILRIIAALANTPVQLPRGATVHLRPHPSSASSGPDSAASEYAVTTSEIDHWGARVHSTINDGVYKCGFATSQQAYDEAVDELYQSMDSVEQRLSQSRFLCSDSTITEADVKLFPTMFRFDAVYAVIFRVCRKSVRADYPHISRWIRDIYHMPGVKQTCDLQQTIDNYFQNLFPLNPSAIVPQVPTIDLSPLPENSLSMKA